MNKRKFLQNIVDDFLEFLLVFVIIAPFHLAAASYRIYLVGESRSLLFRYGTALFNASVLAKIVLIGNLARLGRWTEQNRLIIPVLLKAAIFTVLAMAFHTLEAIVHDLLHGQTFFSALHAVAVGEMGEIARFGVIMFFAFIPFFALFEMRRVLGAEKFRNLFVGGRLRDLDEAATGNRISSTPATN